MINRIEKIFVNQCAYRINDFYTRTLTPETKAQLQSLGIDPSSVASNDEAQKIIDEKKKEKAEKAAKETGQVEQLDSERTLQRKLINLAASIGMNFSENNSIKEMIFKIDDYIKKNMPYLMSLKNSDVIHQAMAISNEFSSLRLVYEKVLRNHEELSNSLDNLAEMNKSILGL